MSKLDGLTYLPLLHPRVGAGLRSVYEFQLVGHLHTGVNTGCYTELNFFQIAVLFQSAQF